MIAVVLRYDPALSAECTWRIADEQDAIEARVRCANGPDVFVRVAGRWRRETAQAPDAVFLSPTDAGLEVWRTESARLHEALPRLSLLLEGCPVHVAESMRVW
jgi:hypothetical protein